MGYFKGAAFSFVLGWVFAVVLLVIAKDPEIGYMTNVFKVFVLGAFGAFGLSLLLLVIGSVQRYREEKLWARIRKELEEHYEEEILP